MAPRKRTRSKRSRPRWEEELDLIEKLVAERGKLVDALVKSFNQEPTGARGAPEQPSDAVEAREEQPGASGRVVARGHQKEEAPTRQEPRCVSPKGRKKRKRTLATTDRMR